MNDAGPSSYYSHSWLALAARWAYRRAGDVAVWAFFALVAGKPKRSFSDVRAPLAPDYSRDAAWCFLPGRRGTIASHYPAEDVDSEASRRCQGEAGSAPADCFYIHATAAVGGVDRYNASAGLESSCQVELVEQSFLGFAAAVNHCCNIYAPRYRQATFGSFLCPFDRESSLAAADLAYADVKRAFAAFLKRTSGQRRPFFLFGHSQGAVHLARLVQDVVDKDVELCQRLVCVYAIGSGNAGLPADLSHLNNLHASRGPADTPGALVSMNLRACDADADLMARNKLRMETQVGRWDVKTGWRDSVARAQALEPVLTVSPASWKVEPSGTVTRLGAEAKLSYRSIQWRDNRAPGLKSMLLGQPEGVKSIAIDRVCSPSYSPAFVQRDQHVLLSPRLEDCNDLALRKLAVDHTFILDEGGYHVIEPTLLHYLIRDNAKKRLDAWAARMGCRNR